MAAKGDDEEGGDSEAAEAEAEEGEEEEKVVDVVEEEEGDHENEDEKDRATYSTATGSPLPRIFLVSLPRGRKQLRPNIRGVRFILRHPSAPRGVYKSGSRLPLANQSHQSSANRSIQVRALFLPWPIRDDNLTSVGNGRTFAIAA